MQQYQELPRSSHRSGRGHHLQASTTPRPLTDTDRFPSHIFCSECSHKSGLSQSREATRKCPACETPLPNADDVVTTVLKPTEDYKTSVLSGLDPATIMECASRGLDFWSYQTTQEMSVHCRSH